jgi:sorbitol-specific phosphotransferase system component IIBC
MGGATTFGQGATVIGVGVVGTIVTANIVPTSSRLLILFAFSATATADVNSVSMDMGGITDITVSGIPTAGLTATTNIGGAGSCIAFVTPGITATYQFNLDVGGTGLGLVNVPSGTNLGYVTLINM